MSRRPHPMCATVERRLSVGGGSPYRSTPSRSNLRSLATSARTFVAAHLSVFVNCTSVCLVVRLPREACAAHSHRNGGSGRVHHQA